MIVIAVIAGAFVLLATVGILAAIAIPNLLTAMQRSKQKRTMADIRAIATAVEAYGSEHRRYPEAASISELARELEPTHLKTPLVKDGWDHDLRYECWADDDPCDSYAIASAGKDGLFEHESLREYTPATVQDFDCDLVYANGVFVTHPPTSSAP
ncbi:MAG TPA: type II secretion system protein GspG [Thermoanaerobaculia bacterium]|nr:type II secretion system protein GspG [Thermoanaerobaculia bacterium]